MNGDPPAEEDFSQIPLVERSQHKVSGSVLGEGSGKGDREWLTVDVHTKNWKARLSAYNDVISGSAKTASDTDPFFQPFVNDGALL